MMDNTINSRTPDEIKRGLECCIPRYESNHWVTCNDECPYRSEGAFCRNVMQNNVRAYIHQLEHERDAAVETLILIANTDCMIPCESDELACSEYCENHCSFSTPQKECWMEYFRRRDVEVE